METAKPLVLCSVRLTTYLQYVTIDNEYSFNILLLSVTSQNHRDEAQLRCPPAFRLFGIRDSSIRGLVKRQSIWWDRYASI